MTAESVSSRELAAILRVTPRRIEQLVAEGLVVRIDRGRYDLVESVGRYCDSLRQTAETATSTTANELAAERLKTIRLRNAERERQLITLEESKTVVERMIGMFVSSLGGLPARISQDQRERRRIETITDQLRQELSDQFRAIRNELATGRSA